MATKHGVAVRRALAIEKLEAGMTAVVERLGIQDVQMATIPRMGKFKDVMQVQQLEVLADWIGQVVDRLAPTPVVGWLSPSPGYVERPAEAAKPEAKPEARPAPSKKKG